MRSGNAFQSSNGTKEIKMLCDCGNRALIRSEGRGIKGRILWYSTTISCSACGMHAYGHGANGTDSFRKAFANWSCKVRPFLPCRCGDYPRIETRRYKLAPYFSVSLDCHCGNHEKAYGASREECLAIVKERWNRKNGANWKIKVQRLFMRIRTRILQVTK